MALLFGYSSSVQEEDIDMDGNKITNLPAPTSLTEPVTKGYADTHYSGGSGQQGPKGDKGDTGPQGPKGDKGDTGLQGPQGPKDNTGSRGPKGDTGPQGITGSRGLTESKGDTGLKGDQGPKGDKGDKGDQGIQGVRGDKGDQGSQGSRGLKGSKGDKSDKSDTGPKGDKGDPGSGGLSDTGFTMQGNINMNANRITYVPDPLTNNEPVTRQYGDRTYQTYLTNAGFVMQDNIGMNNHMVTNLGTPTNNTDAATKKYVDDKKARFKSGMTTTNVVDLRDMGLNGSLELYNNITFDGGAYCRDINSSTSTGKEIVNKNKLETGHLITLQSLSPTLSRLFQTAVKKELLVLKGKPGSLSVICKDPSVNRNPSFTSDASSVDLTISFTNDLSNGIYKYMFDLILSTTTNIKVFLYGECGGRDIMLLHGMIIGMVVPVAVLRKMMLTVVTSIEGTVLISTFQDSFGTLGIAL